jgi:hypothetical protein
LIFSSPIKYIKTSHTKILTPTPIGKLNIPQHKKPRAKLVAVEISNLRSSDLFIIFSLPYGVLHNNL